MNYTQIIKLYRKTGGEEAALRSAQAVDNLLESVKQNDPKAYMQFMRDQHEVWCGPHFDEDFAKWQVDQMFHKGADEKVYRGEHWTLEDTNDVFSRYSGKIPAQYTEFDFYVALNAQYHDYCVWAKQHFPEDYEQRIIEMAIRFWFLDEDYEGKGKVWDYFSMNEC